MASGPISADQLTEYRLKGYTLVRRMFDSQEVDLLRRSAKQDKTLDGHAFERDSILRNGGLSATSALFPVTACTRSLGT